MKEGSKKTIGALCGIGAAVCYGTNPLGALKLYGEGLNTPSVLLCRFSIAFVILLVIMLLRSGKERIAVSRRDFGILTVLGILFIFSSLTLYTSFTRMEAGVASTILFVYPIMTSVIMTVCFKEKIRFRTVLAIILSLCGVVLLYWTGKGTTLDTLGVILVLISALSYSLTIIIIDRGRLEMSALKINLYVTGYCSIGMLAYALIAGMPVILPHTSTGIFYSCFLGIVPTVFSLLLMVNSAKLIGSTATSIVGALEPLTAVLIGVTVFGESFSLRLVSGIVLILFSVVLTLLPGHSSVKKNKQCHAQLGA